jgi:ADP-heptose:LPS heptosyltransferase
MENILVIRIKSIGDVIFTLPAVNALREHFPAAKITFLTAKENSTLLRGFEAVNETIALDRGALRGGNPVKMGREFFGLLYRLRAARFSLVVDFQGFGETAWLCRITGAPRRWGSVYGPGRRWAYTRGLVRNEKVHPANWNLELLAGCGVDCRRPGNQFSLPADARAAARACFSANSLDQEKPTLVIQPLTSTAQKNWPLGSFLAVAHHWRAAGVQVIFVGGPADDSPLEPARQAGFPVVTDLPLLGSAGLVQLSALMLGGDSGLGHLAVALGRQVIMLMRHANPGACFPFQHSDWAVLPARPNHIEEIGVPVVLAETARVLNPLIRSVSC